MEKYTVNRQWLVGKNGKQYRGGDVITSAQVANIDELVANGSISLFEAENTDDKIAKNTDDKSNDAPILFTFENEKNEVVEVKSVKDASKAELVMLLGRSTEPFNPADSKQDLFDLYLTTLEPKED